jgi:hypothetical protein
MKKILLKDNEGKDITTYLEDDEFALNSFRFYLTPKQKKEIEQKYINIGKKRYYIEKIEEVK